MDDDRHSGAKRKKGSALSNVLGWAVAVTLALALIGQFASVWPLHLAVYVLDALLVAGMAGFFLFMKKNIHGSQICQKSDPLFSRQAFQRRAEYLYRLYHLAKDLDVTLLRPFLDAESYAKLERENVPDEFYYLDNDFYQLLTPSFKIENGKQWTECTLSVFEVTINEKRRIKKKKKKARMVLVRNEGCKTEPRNGAELYLCEHCGASVNLAQDGVCKYCGNQIDLQNHDWCIHQIEEA